MVAAPNPFTANLAAAHQDREVTVWAENTPVFQLFCDQQTQWRVGAMGGATGLDYTCAHRTLDRMGLSPEELNDFESDLRVLEHAALAEMNKEKEEHG